MARIKCRVYACLDLVHLAHRCAFHKSSHDDAKQTKIAKRVQVQEFCESKQTRACTSCSVDAKFIKRPSRSVSDAMNINNNHIKRMSEIERKKERKKFIISA